MNPRPRMNPRLRFRFWFRGRSLLPRMLLLLIGGAIINVAVAWGCALLIPIDYRSRAQHDVFNDRDGTGRFPFYTAYRWRQIGAWRVQVYKGNYSGLPWKNNATFEELIPSWGSDFLHVPELSTTMGRGTKLDGYWGSLSFGDRAVDARGWPILSLWGGIRSPLDSLYITTSDTPYRLSRGWLVHGVLPVDDRLASGATNHASLRYLPYLPLWPGFAINTLFYAAILWLLFAAPGLIRRRVRRKRGLCAACAYDLRGSDSKTCPECGMVVRT